MHCANMPPSPTIEVTNLPAGLQEPLNFIYKALEDVVDDLDEEEDMKLTLERLQHASFKHLILDSILSKPVDSLS